MDRKLVVVAGPSAKDASAACRSLSATASALLVVPKSRPMTGSITCYPASLNSDHTRTLKNMQESPVKIDALLEPLLTATTDEHADELLSQLIAGHAEPVIKGVIRFKLRFNSHQETQRAEADDIHQDVVLQLVTQLQRFRKLPETHPITDVRGMAAIIAHRTCARWMRRQFPERHALKNRLHYLLTRQRGFAIWDDDNGKSIAGFAVWQQQKKAAVRNLSDVAAHLRKAQQLAETVASIFDYAGGPIEFDELVTAVASIEGVSDQPVESLAEDEDE